MGEKLFGIPLVVWSLLCFGIAVIWIYVWPSDRVVESTGARYLILRWSHFVVWVLLGLAALVADLNVADGAKMAKAVALVSLAVYLIFLGTLATSRRVG